jgi:hypothetical protein
MVEIFNTVEPYVEKTYGIPIKITDVADPFTGDLDGQEIHVDYAEDIESALFIIAHLFGHTAQWNTDPKTREIGYRLYKDPTPEEMRALKSYEHEACCYSLQLFHDAGVRDIDPWVSDYSACDFAYLEHFYTTGEKRPFRSFWKDGCPLLVPKKIPPFKPEKWVGRIQGIVV